MQKITSGVLLSLFLAGLFPAGCRPAEPARTSAPTVLAQFPIPEAGDPILLPVSFEGREYLFKLDTASSHTVFDTSLKDKLGKAIKAVKVKTAAGPIKGELFHAPDAFLGPLNLKDCRRIGVIDIDPGSPVGQKKYHGIIGMNFLKKYVVQIDSDEGLLSFLEPEPDRGIFSFLWPKTKKHSDWGQEIRIEHKLLSPIPYIKGSVDGKKVTFMVDTGYVFHIDSPNLPVSDTTGELEARIFKMSPSKIQYETTRTHRIPGKAGTSSQSTSSAAFARFSIGTLQYKDVIFDQSQKSVLGMPFLSRHLVTFDFPNHRMYLKKNEHFDKPSCFYISLTKPGFVIRRKSDDIFVHSVDPKDTAYRKGVRQDDIILKIDDIDVRSYALVELVELFRQLDKKEIQTITFTMKHRDGIKQISFRRGDTLAGNNGTD